MRVSEEGRAGPRTADPAAARSRGRFAELLRRHGAEARAGAGNGAEAARRPGTPPASAGAAAAGARGEPAGARRPEGPAPGRRPTSARAGRAPAALEPGGEPAAAAGRGPSAPAPSPPPGSPPVVDPARTSLALAVRAVVPAVEAFRLGGREALSLDFGRALGVELRQRPGGVELSLDAAAALAPAARAELPGLLRALAARGVPVLRAEVRERGVPRGAPRERR